MCCCMEACRDSDALRFSEASRFSYLCTSHPNTHSKQDYERNLTNNAMGQVCHPTEEVQQVLTSL